MDTLQWADIVVFFHLRSSLVSLAYIELSPVCDISWIINEVRILQRVTKANYTRAFDQFFICILKINGGKVVKTWKYNGLVSFGHCEICEPHYYAGNVPNQWRFNICLPLVQCPSLPVVPLFLFYATRFQVPPIFLYMSYYYRLRMCKALITLCLTNPINFVNVCQLYKANTEFVSTDKAKRNCLRATCCCVRTKGNKQS